MKKPSTKASGIFGSVAMPDPQSTMQLEGKHATTMKSHQIGKKVTMTVKATKHSHRMNSDGTHSAEFKIHGVKINDTDETGGPDTKGAKDDEDSSEARE